jgi:ectoine hydroxylase-related dioxygenase (phytanoyl-CoA dioxygenase family)
MNQGFEWRPIEGPYRRLTAAQAESYNDRGFFILEDAVAPDLLGRVIAEIDPLEEKTEAMLAEQEGGRLFINRAGELTFTTHLVRESRLLREFVMGPTFQDLAFDILGPDVRLYWDQAVYKKPGAQEEFPWHQDNGYTFIDPQQYLTCYLALTDVSLENGCPEIMPGEHQRGTLMHTLTDLGFRCAPSDVSGVTAEARAGSIIVFSSLTPHRTGPNLTGDVRKAYIVQFAPDGVGLVFRDDQGIEKRIPATDPARQFSVLVDGRPA